VWCAIALWTIPAAAVHGDIVWHSELDGDAMATVGGVDGVLNGDTAGTADRFGNANGALLFDGSGDNVTIDRTTLPASFSQATLTAWVRLDGGSGDRGAISVAQTGGGQSEYFNILSDPNSWRVDLDDGDDGIGRKSPESTTGYVTGEWHFLANAWTAGDTVRLYVDGVEAGSVSIAGGESTIDPTTGSSWIVGAL
jgi:hypothetical protein